MATPGTTSLNPLWSRIANTTIRDYIRVESINILRKRILTAMMLKKGRVTYNHAGTAIDWKVRYRQAPMIGYAEGDNITFSRQDRWKSAMVDWRSYQLSDAMTKLEYLQNRNSEAIIKMFDTRIKNLKDDASQQFGESLYMDGTLQSNLKGIQGIETFMDYSTQVVGNGACTPTAVYAGLSCVPGFFGGNWSAPSSGLVWPNGKGDVSYDFWSPTIIDVGDTMFSSTNTWKANCVEAVAYGIIKSQKSPATDGELAFFLLNEVAYQQYISQLRSLQRIVVNGRTSEMVSLGFTDTVQQDGGKDVTWEYGLPSASQLNSGVGVIGYGFNLDQVELMSMQADLWESTGPTFNEYNKSWHWGLDFVGNMRWNPKYQVKLFNKTNTSDSAQP